MSVKRNETTNVKAALKDNAISARVTHSGDAIIIYTAQYIKDGSPEHLNIVRVVQDATGRHGTHDTISALNGGIVVCEDW